VESVERRGKHQFVRLDDGSVLHVHFRMAGDWEIGRAADPVPRHARALLELDDDTRVALVDPRALGTLRVHRAGDASLPVLGPEATDAGLDAETLRRAFAAKRGAVKPALLDQRIIAGLGNIYAAEALWWARISPLTPARTLGRARLERLVAGIREALARGADSPARYSSAEGGPLEVYDREGQPCSRCGARIRRITQAGRSTYYCPRCQRR
jgi:formamidopyrimidine-DNA glycosylase